MHRGNNDSLAGFVLVELRFTQCKDQVGDRFVRVQERDPLLHEVDRGERDVAPGQELRHIRECNGLRDVER